MNPNKPIDWWMILKDDAVEVIKFLQSIVDNDDHFPATREEARAALHTLETGLHKTDAIPTDFAEPAHDPQG